MIHDVLHLLKLTLLVRGSLGFGCFSEEGVRGEVGLEGLLERFVGEGVVEEVVVEIDDVVLRRVGFIGEFGDNAELVETLLWKERSLLGEGEGVILILRLVHRKTVIHKVTLLVDLVVTIHLAFHIGVLLVGLDLVFIDFL